MKQYLNETQTIKLIELGFAEPRSIRYPKNEEEAERVDSIDFLISDYSIGELIEMLPTIVDDFTLWIGRDERSNQWFVKYHPRTLVVDEELIDALYNMILNLKEERII